MDLTGLNDKPELIGKLKDLHESIDKMERMIEVVYSGIKREELGIKEKTDLNLFTAYTLNTLYWMYLRTTGVDPNETDIKKELARVRDYMVKAKNATDRLTIRPTVDQGAAKRFVKHGIGHGNKDSGDDRGNEPPKKRKR